MKTRTLGPLLLGVVLVLISLAALSFALHASRFGWAGLTGRASGSHLSSLVVTANLAIFGHMISGAVITILAPLQLVSTVRRRFPAVHRWSGRAIVVFGCATGLGGLGYIALRGTIGGLHMSIAFAIYGLLVLICALQTLRHARARRWDLHRDWALRLFFLCIGSWLYRVHYALWSVMTDKAGMQPGFTGWFDLVNLWAFYLPYLGLLELALWTRGRGLWKELRK